MSLLKEYLWLCWFKSTPEQLQPSKAFFSKAVIFYLLLGITVEANISDPADAVLEIFAETIVTLILVTGFLLYKKQLARFIALLTALIMAENFIFVLGLLTEMVDMLTQKTDYEDYPAYAGAALAVWLLTIIAYIFKKFFQFKTPVSLTIALAYLLFTFLCPFLFMEVL